MRLQAGQPGGGDGNNGKPGDDSRNDDKKENELTFSITGHKQLSSLVDFMDTEIENKMSFLKSVHCRMVSFSDIWYLFKPGDLVVGQSRRQAYRVISVRSCPHKVFPPWRTTWDKDAKEAEATPVTLSLPTSLCRDQGATEDLSEGTPSMKIPELREDLIDVADLEKDREHCSADCCQCEDIHNDQYVEKRRDQDYMATLVPEDREQEPPLTIYPRLLRDIKSSGHEIPESDLIIMSYRVFGFILRSRKWVVRELGHVWDTSGTAFDQLVLPKGHKEMVLSLIAQHFRDKEPKEDQQVDIVAGKGKGLIVLLHGAPGVGKTTTAELFGRPLFQITCGDLGTTASEVEAALETHFTLANRWGCVLLLDEADVFLAARSKQDFIRNGLVSGKRMPPIIPSITSLATSIGQEKLTPKQIFLRVLEYYAGILFLTTNRVGDFDEAFTSRIHISLYYPQLDAQSTKAIFELNLNMIQRRFDQRRREIKIERGKILDFAWDYFANRADRKWNGRQIRNACQTALALAESHAQGGKYERVEHADAVVHLQADDLETVAAAYLQFMHYLDKVHGMDSEKLAKLYALRARELDLLNQWEAENGRAGGDRKRGNDMHREHHLSTRQMHTPYPGTTISQPPRSATPNPYASQQQFHGGMGTGASMMPTTVTPQTAAAGYYSNTNAPCATGYQASGAGVPIYSPIPQAPPPVLPQHQPVSVPQVLGQPAQPSTSDPAPAQQPAQPTSPGWWFWGRS
ncbi:hypothetical protein OQA88_915 [Cercophora sp. LCS_1]